jgi:mannitol-specific phosphotransferase system IIBC component
MNWSFALIGFALAVFMGAALVSFLTTIRPQWSALRRLLTAASVLPSVTILATLAAILFVSTAEHGQAQTMEDLAITALATIGGGFTLLALAGGLVGAGLAGRRRRG